MPGGESLGSAAAVYGLRIGELTAQLSREAEVHQGNLEGIREACRVIKESNPAVHACRRVRLPADHLYVHRSAVAVNAGPFRQVT